MMKTITKFMTLCAIGVCSVTASAQTTIFEKGTEAKPWLDTDCTKPTYERIEDGNLVNQPNTANVTDNDNYSFSVTAQNYDHSLFTISATVTAESASGRNGSYDHWDFGPISVRWYNENKSVVLIDGIEYTIAETQELVRKVTYIVNATINTATGKVNVSVIPGSSDEKTFDGAVTSVADYSTFKYGHYRAGRENYVPKITLDEVIITQKEVVAETAEYTVNFIDTESNVLKTEKRSAVINNSITLIATDKEPFFVEDQKYIYVSDDSEDKTIASDSSTVVTVTYREAATYHYSVEAKLEGIDETQAIMDGVVFEGESVTIPFSMHQVSSDGVLYKTNGIDDNKKQYNYTITPTEDNQIIYIEYTTTDVTDVVFFKEAENIESMISSTGNSGTAGIRSSNSKVAYAKENNVKVVDLPAGKYSIYADIYGGQNATGELSVMIGEQTKTFTSVSNTYHSLQSWDVDIASPDALYILPGGGNGVAFDYIYIVRTGESTAVESIKAEQPADDNYYDLSGRKVANPVKGNIYINGGKLIRY
jgi:hypothetical protein